jgi:hypothetical protein
VPSVAAPRVPHHHVFDRDVIVEPVQCRPAEHAFDTAAGRQGRNR